MRAAGYIRVKELPMAQRRRGFHSFRGYHQPKFFQPRRGNPHRGVCSSLYQRGRYARCASPSSVSAFGAAAYHQPDQVRSRWRRAPRRNGWSNGSSRVRILVVVAYRRGLW